MADRTSTDVSAAARAIDERLPEIARSVIREYLDPNDPYTDDFIRNPDGREQHQTHWHQWGIITHTRVFLAHFDREIPDLLRSWKLWNPVDAWMRQQVDGATRWELLRISILLHDIGKFGARTRGTRSFHFSHHEALSGEIIRSKVDLAALGLASHQITYIAQTAQDHFVLGLVRKRAREEGSYDLAFTRTTTFTDLAGRIRNEHADDYVEIGLLFLGDSLAKFDPRQGPEQAVSQHETNIVVARRYLEIVLQECSV